jgi:hypothetical protein
MSTTMRIPRPVLALAFVLVAAAPAAADDDLALMATGAYMMPRGDLGEAYGGGAEARMADDHMTIGFGARALVGQTPSVRRRDVMDVDFNVGLMMCDRCKSVAPYVSVGLDILHITTHEPTRSIRGSTLGLSGHAGLMGRLGGDDDEDDAWIWRAGVQYLGAIVPGTGEDLGGITLSIAIGKQIMD